MLTVKRQKALSCLQLMTLIIVPCFIVTCTEEQGTSVKNDTRNLRNSASTFIYNMIPENAQAVISPEYSTAINAFSVNLLDEVYKDESCHDKNVVLSPFCVSRNLAIITEAATGASKQELLDALGGRVALDDATSALSRLLYADNSILLQCADAIWVDSTKYTLLPSFKDTANVKYGVEAGGLDFGNVQGSVNTINKWIAVNTENHFTDLVGNSYFTPLTAAILTSAIYFEADWASPFDVTQTHVQSFSTPTGSVEAAMMTSMYRHRTFKTGEYENVKLYYGTGGKDFFYLDVYMPTTIPIEEFIGEKCLAALGDQDSTGYGGLIMPKFFFEKKVDLKPILKNMGVKGVFDTCKSEITGMVSPKNTQDTVPLYIKLIMHKAGIKTDEEGTVAYAVTVTTMEAGGAPEPSPDVALDRPFVYFLRAGENGLVLFAGVVNNPNDTM